MSGDRDARTRAAFERSYPAAPASVGTIRTALSRFAREQGLPDETIESLALAVSEAVTNVVVHAYANQPHRGRVNVTATIAGNELWVIVADSGSGLQPRRDSPGLGLGLAIIARVADGVDLVNSAGGGLEVRMRFAAPAR
jgi:anti-sigma regulatory factor (Ser/Thr protein kinase)